MDVFPHSSEVLKVTEAGLYIWAMVDQVHEVVGVWDGRPRVVTPVSQLLYNKDRLTL